MAQCNFCKLSHNSWLQKSYEWKVNGKTAALVGTLIMRCNVESLFINSKWQRSFSKFSIMHSIAEIYAWDTAGFAAMFVMLSEKTNARIVSGNASLVSFFSAENSRMNSNWQRSFITRTCRHRFLQSKLWQPEIWVDWPDMQLSWLLLALDKQNKIYLNLKLNVIQCS